MKPIRDREGLERAVLRQFGGRTRPTLGARELERKLGLSRGLIRSLRAVLGDLLKRGLIEQVGFRYRLGRNDGLFEGRVEVSEDGRIRVRGAERSLDLPDLGEAQSGDRVLVRELSGAGSGRAELHSLVESRRSHRIGLVERGRHGFRVVPYRDSERWSIPVTRKDLSGAEVGEVVDVEISELGRSERENSGRVVERLGFPGDPEADFRAVAWHRRLPVEFSGEARDEAEGIAAGLDPAELARRKDLRDRGFLTIDPESARDHDDAIFVESLSGGDSILWVAIADVSHYVPPFSALDREAWLRGNSVYFPGRSIPMLPDRLSGELCSLRPDEDRYVIAAEMRLDPRGGLVNAEIHEAVIRSRMRLSYSDAGLVMQSPARETAMAELTEKIPGMNADVAEQLRALGVACAALRRERLSRGSIDFDFPEPEFILDSSGRAVDVKRAERGVANHAVEEAMLLTNQVVAKALMEAREPTVYRVHDVPDPADLEKLGKLYRSFGLAGSGPKKSFGRKELLAGMRSVEGHKEEAFLQYATLRTMQQADYSEHCKGHFALGFDHYLHFTSPIRRYADLVVHRAIRKVIRGQAMPTDRDEAMERIAIRTSARERIAVSAEREMNDLMRCTVMRGRVGETFEATVTGVARQGLYVTLDAPFVEGLVPISSLDGYFDYDEDRRCLIARRSGFRHALGDRRKVRLNSVDPVRGWVNFLLAASPDGVDKSGRKQSRGKGSGTKRTGQRKSLLRRGKR